MQATNTSYPFQLFPDVAFGHRVQLPHPRSLRIGAKTCLADDVWLSVCHDDGQPKIIVGRSVLVGRRSMISSGGLLEVASFCLLAPNVYISNVDHKYEGNHLGPILTNGEDYRGPLVIEENCWLGINSVVSGGFTVGRGSVVAANAVVNAAVAPFSVVVGAPARTVRMLDPSDNAWKPIRTDDDVKRIEEARAQFGLPSREDYAATLEARGPLKLGGLLAGPDRCVVE